MKTLDEALAVFSKEEVVSFKWDKEVNPDTGRGRRGCWYLLCVLYVSCIVAVNHFSFS